MGLFLRNMKFHIFHNSCENMSHNIMQDRLLPEMWVMKNVDPHKIQRLTKNAIWQPKN
jgi:hypothetical protein